VAGNEGDAAHDDRFRMGPHWLQLDAGDDRADHLRHLYLRKCGADAAADAAAEGKPGVGGRLFLDEALGTELVGLA